MNHKSKVLLTLGLALSLASPQSSLADCEQAYRGEIAGLAGAVGGLSLQTQIGGAAAGATLGGMFALGMFNPVFGLVVGVPAATTAVFRTIKAKRLKNRVTAALTIDDAIKGTGPRLRDLTQWLGKHGFDVNDQEVATAVVKGNTEEAFCSGAREPYAKIKFAGPKEIRKYVTTELASSRNKR